MAYKVVCKTCCASSRIAQSRGLRMKDYICKCGGELRRIGWQEMYRNSGRAPKTAAMIAAEHLRATNNQAVGWGDSRLLHEIGAKIGVAAEGYKTEKIVLDRIERSHQGVLEKRFIGLPERGLGRVRQFWLPEVAPQSLILTRSSYG